MLYEVITHLFRQARLPADVPAQGILRDPGKGDRPLPRGEHGERSREHECENQQADERFDHRITSYNVCYTKLLRVSLYLLTQV